MDTIRTRMPALLRHEGVWEGVYRHIDANDATMERHASRIEVLFPQSGPYAYHQRNRFEWPDGRVAETEYPGVYRDGRLWWDTDHIEGQAWQVDDRSCVLTWRRKDTPGAHLYEIIVIAEDGRTRTRTWHWFRNGTCVQRTLIDETKVG